MLDILCFSLILVFKLNVLGKLSCSCGLSYHTSSYSGIRLTLFPNDGGISTNGKCFFVSSEVGSYKYGNVCLVSFFYNNVKLLLIQ